VGVWAWTRRLCEGMGWPEACMNHHCRIHLSTYVEMALGIVGSSQVNAVALVVLHAMWTELPAFLPIREEW